MNAQRPPSIPADIPPTSPIPRDRAAAHGDRILSAFVVQLLKGTEVQREAGAKFLVMIAEEYRHGLMPTEGEGGAQ